MTIFLTRLLGKLNWGALIGAVVAIAGIVFGMFRNQQAKTATAEAERKIAEKTTEVAQGNAAASKAETNAVITANEVKKEVSKLPDSELDRVGREMGILRDD